MINDKYGCWLRMEELVSLGLSDEQVFRAASEAPRITDDFGGNAISWYYAPAIASALHRTKELGNRCAACLKPLARGNISYCSRKCEANARWWKENGRRPFMIQMSTDECGLPIVVALPENGREVVASLVDCGLVETEAEALRVMLLSGIRSVQQRLVMWKKPQEKQEVVIHNS